MGLIAVGYRYFVYDPEIDGVGAYKLIGGCHATSQRDALEQLQRNTSRLITIQEANGMVVGNSEGLQFIAREESKPETWPNANTGRLPRSENAQKQADFPKVEGMGSGVV